MSDRLATTIINIIHAYSGDDLPRLELAKRATIKIMEAIEAAKDNEQPDGCREAFEKWQRYKSIGADGAYYTHKQDILWEGFQYAWNARPMREIGSLTEEDKQWALEAMVDIAQAKGYSGNGMASALEALLDRFDMRRRT